jgi:hypothetical protein
VDESEALTVDEPEAVTVDEPEAVTVDESEAVTSFPQLSATSNHTPRGDMMSITDIFGSANAVSSSACDVTFTLKPSVSSRPRLNLGAFFVV